jgi:hypothetical protein
MPGSVSLIAGLAVEDQDRLVAAPCQLTARNPGGRTPWAPGVLLADQAVQLVGKALVAPAQSSCTVPPAAGPETSNSRQTPRSAPSPDGKPNTLTCEGNRRAADNRTGRVSQ